MTKQFDSSYFDGDKLILWKSTGEGSGFQVEIFGGIMELYEIPMYGGMPRLEKSWEYVDPIEAYNLAITWC